MSSVRGGEAQDDQDEDGEGTTAPRVGFFTSPFSHSLQPLQPLTTALIGSHMITEHKMCLTHRHRLDKYLDTLLASQTARKALPPTKATIAKRGNRKMADCPSYY